MLKQYVEDVVLTAAQLPGKLGEPKLIRIVEPIHKADYKKEGRAEANDVCLVEDLDPENPNPLQKYLWTVPAVAKSELEKKFPGQKYVGKVIRVTRWAKTAGQKASPVDLVVMKEAK
jgi:hypothetical protein